MKRLIETVREFLRKIRGPKPKPEPSVTITRGSFSLARWWIVLVLALPGCDELTGPPDPIHVFSHQRMDGSMVLIPASPFTPPAVYARWYRKVETCAGLRGDASRLTYYTMPELVLVGPGVWLYGFQADDAIVVAAPWAADSTLIMHEQQHHNLRRNGLVPRSLPAGISRDSIDALIHPPRYFADCGIR